jgi:hypothetical protein
MVRIPTMSISMRELSLKIGGHDVRVLRHGMAGCAVPISEVRSADAKGEHQPLMVLELDRSASLDLRSRATRKARPTRRPRADPRFQG